MNKILSVGLSALVSALAICPLNAGTMGPVAYDHNWTGIYIGGNLGGMWSRIQGPVTIAPPIVTNASSLNLNVSPSSFTGGGQIGYNWQRNHLVLGAEAILNAEHLQSRVTLGTAGLPLFFVTGDNFGFKNTMHSAILARAGYAKNNWFVYATGGVAFANLTVDANFPRTLFIPSSAAHNQQLTAGTYGLGAEYAVGQHWQIGLEGRYTDYGSQHYDLGIVAVPLIFIPPFVLFPPVTANIHLKASEVLFKVNYQFA